MTNNIDLSHPRKFWTNDKFDWLKKYPDFLKGDEKAKEIMFKKFKWRFRKDIRKFEQKSYVKKISKAIVYKRFRQVHSLKGTKVGRGGKIKRVKVRSRGIADLKLNGRL